MSATACRPPARSSAWGMAFWSRDAASICSASVRATRAKRVRFTIGSPSRSPNEYQMERFVDAPSFLGHAEPGLDERAGALRRITPEHSGVMQHEHETDPRAASLQFAQAVDDSIPVPAEVVREAQRRRQHAKERLLIAHFLARLEDVGQPQHLAARGVDVVDGREMHRLRGNGREQARMDHVRFLTTTKVTSSFGGAVPCHRWAAASSAVMTPPASSAVAAAANSCTAAV